MDLYSYKCFKDLNYKNFQTLTWLVRKLRICWNPGLCWFLAIIWAHRNFSSALLDSVICEQHSSSFFMLPVGMVIFIYLTICLKFLKVLQKHNDLFAPSGRGDFSRILSKKQTVWQVFHGFISVWLMDSKSRLWATHISAKSSAGFISV